jgi:hypothetical protein
MHLTVESIKKRKGYSWKGIIREETALQGPLGTQDGDLEGGAYIKPLL